MAATARELTIALQQDRPGMLAKAAEAIAMGGLNLDGFAEVEGMFHVLTADPRSARHALEAVGLRVVSEREVVVQHAEDRPGAAAALFRLLAEAGVDVAYTYVASGNRIVVATDSPQRAVAVLSGL